MTDGRSRSRDPWERDRLASGLYAGAAARAWLGRPLARLLWAADARHFYRERRRTLELPQGSLVLDAPCGAGALFPPPPSVRLGPHHVGVDLSDLMLARARRAASAHRLEQVHLVRADAHQLPFADGAFELVLAHNSLHCYPDPARAVGELARVLVPGGVLRGSTIVVGAGRRSDLMISAALKLGMFARRVQGADLEAWLHAAGLKDVAIETSGAMRFFSARREERR